MAASLYFQGDAGPLPVAGGEEALEQKAVIQRVHVGHAGQEGDEAPGDSPATGTHSDPLVASVGCQIRGCNHRRGPAGAVQPRQLPFQARRGIRPQVRPPCQKAIQAAKAKIVKAT